MCKKNVENDVFFAYLLQKLDKFFFIKYNIRKGGDIENDSKR